ncbi:MAG: GGDEF domain-containing protein [Oscillospiraceae bacterium]
MKTLLIMIAAIIFILFSLAFNLSGKMLNLMGLSAENYMLYIDILSTLLLIFLLLSIFFFVKNRYYKNQSKNDKITGLNSYAMVNQAYNGFSKGGVGYTCVLIKLDNFVEIANLFGYEAVENYTLTISDVLKKFVKRYEYVTKIKGRGVFALILKTNDMYIIRDRLLALQTSLEKMNILCGETKYDYVGKFSISVYPIMGTESDFDGVIRNSNLNFVPWYQKKDATTYEDLVMREKLLPDVYDAIKQKHFVPYFQIRYDAQTKNVVGAEIFARWKHPKYGILKPRSFISLLEMYGLIDDLDMQMFCIACEITKSRKDKGLLLMPLAVNMSLQNMYQLDFIKNLINIFNSYNIEAKYIEIIITTNEHIENDEVLNNVLNKLIDTGFVISMSKLGNLGFSTDLLAVPFKKYIIDCEHINDNGLTQNEKIIPQIIKFVAEEKSITLVAKNVLTKTKYEYSKLLECNSVQGSYFSNLMDKKEFENFILNIENYIHNN